MFGIIRFSFKAIKWIIIIMIGVKVYAFAVKAGASGGVDIITSGIKKML